MSGGTDRILEWHTASADETRERGRALARVLEAGSVVALNGELGAGKTTFVQGLAEALDCREPVSSPTFVLLRIYHGRLPVYHFDAYRLDGPRALDDFGADEYFWGDGVSLIEWASQVEEALPPDHLTVELAHEGESSRRLRLHASGPRHQALLARLDRAAR